jgi:uncharacterized protein (TIGR04255 family)
MAQPRHLQRAPITEAIIDFRVKARKDLDPQAFLSLRAELAGVFPEVEERRGVETTFQLVVSEGLTPQTRDLGLHAVFYKSADAKNVAQFRVDGFTFNRLKPYTSWAQILPLALWLWRRYAETARPELVTRIALRYINHIRLPSTLRSFETYLTAPPRIPRELPQTISGFLSRVVLHDVQAELAATLTQALEGDLTTTTSTVILDIDAYRVADLQPADRGIDDTLRALHDFKNRIFFSSVTEETVSLLS